MIDIQEKKDKVISFLEANGPSLPIRIAKTIEMDLVVASAIISELLSLKEVKMSHLKIGASSLYFLPGQEQRIEEYTDNLRSVEKSAFLKLRKNKLIIDEKEEPAIRVALRNIRDFAIPFKFNEKIMWKYAFASNEEIEKLLSSFKKESKIEVKTKEESKSKIEELKLETKIKKDETKKVENIFVSSELQKDKPELKFLTEIKNFLKQKKIEFIEEVRTEKKEIMAIINVSSQLGSANFLLVAKNKKTVTKDEIEAAIQIATKNKMSCLLIIRKAPSKPIQKFVDENHLIKIEIMK